MRFKLEHEPFNAAQFKRADAGSYDPVAEDFDALGSMQLPFARRLIELAQVAGAQRVLDVGTGSGIAAIEAARRLSAGARVVGIDLSSGFLATANRNAEKEALPAGVGFLRMDAEQLAFADSSFDVVLSMFALAHFPEPLRALREMLRVLRPGGRAVLAVGSAPPFSIMGLAHRATRLPDLWRRQTGRSLIAPGFLEQLLNERHRAVAFEETEFARKSKRRTGSTIALMKEAAFGGIRFYWEGRQETFLDPEHFWTVQAVYSSVARKRLAGLNGDQINALKSEFLERCRKVLASGGRLTYPHSALFAIGRRI